MDKLHVLYTVKVKFKGEEAGGRIIKRKHLSKCAKGKMSDQLQFVYDFYSQLYNTNYTEMVGLDMKFIPVAEYDELYQEVYE
ncbi:TPA: hypothetical protein QCU10_004262 [Bacillus anthracis]|uniref:hypothetical protein n=1 Tax=Bacillus anthracis TaxID=1392 RepID=UPI0005A48E94|nr:hypothetical protein [Bacillus cereus]HDR4495432.1 hypothetical protein [Bacillus cereus biovar anthracis]HDR6229518.1 hypothetical protein [Bacillus cereus biovar anthracis]HDR6234365.1 hypothetical protein [Bacillus cereus biovar anthracis]HDR6240557.1 hypothetical protein [Bacillus cereus biovar anthracis]HDR6252281.1 hypothetical protein [Bacillus cereus biovar anthracis]